jgi:general secretion pathway protein F/type IV pilus assembly protein PilC
MATFYSQLADLLHSGVPLLRLPRHSRTAVGLRDAGRGHPRVRSRVADGTSLAEAMSKHPNAFTELAVSMVRAGRRAASLEDSLKRIAEFTENR